MKRTESIDRHIEDAGNTVGEVFKDLFRKWVDNSDQLESPLEAIFGVWWQTFAVCKSYMREPDAGELVPQVEVTIGAETYRLDFVITPPHAVSDAAARAGVAGPLIAVELDGHDFHERTKEQVAQRNTRDCDLQTAGWSVLHFSGSELHQHPSRCVSRTRIFAIKRYKDFVAALPTNAS